MHAPDLTGILRDGAIAGELAGCGHVQDCLVCPCAGEAQGAEVSRVRCSLESRQASQCGGATSQQNGARGAIASWYKENLRSTYFLAQAIEDLPGENYMLDIETALLDVTFHDKAVRAINMDAAPASRT
jgi:hypothetical protein